MKRTYLLLACCFVLTVASHNIYAQTATVPGGEKSDARSKSDPDVRATQWVKLLNLTDTAKEARVTAAIITHLTAVRDWHNNHPYTMVTEGMNPITGKVFNKLERQVIIDSTIPKSVHDDLMASLHKDLTDDQIEQILDKYTIGKVAFTLNGYKSIVPDLTTADEAFILTNLKQAREQAIDYKNMDEISTIFKIYKTKIEAYFTNSGRNWHDMYKAYADKQKAKKSAGK